MGLFDIVKDVGRQIFDSVGQLASAVGNNILGHIDTSGPSPAGPHLLVRDFPNSPRDRSGPHYGDE